MIVDKIKATEICPKCDGCGFTHYTEYLESHPRDLEYDYVRCCEWCEGSGMIRKIIITEIFPYSSNPPSEPTAANQHRKSA